MRTSSLRWSIGSERTRSVLLILLWGVSIATVYAQTVFSRASSSLLNDAIIFVICFVAGVVLMDIGKALFSYIAAMTIGLGLLLVLAIVPDLGGAIPPPGDSFFVALWIGVLFRLVFPVQIIAFLAASIIGSIVGESIFY